MKSREDLEPLVRAARSAALKLKREYDRCCPDRPEGESWAEGEALWHALEPFEEIDHA